MTGVIERDSMLPPESDDYRFEVARLATFKNWPCSWVKPEALAAAGFYYTGKSDMVRCFECHLGIWEWQAGSNPKEGHKHGAARCKFIQDIPCGNVPIGADPSTIPEPEPKEDDECGWHVCLYDMIDKGGPYSGPDHEGTEEEKVKHMYESPGLALKPQHPLYANYAIRLASFDRWPIAMSQTKESLATAGFFYTGSGDQTSCFHCGGELRDWKPQDDPWIEHAKWFEHCSYLVLIKGMAFVSNITGGEYIATENSVTQLNEKVEKLSLMNTESIASGSSQNSTTSEEANTTEESAVSGETRSEEQSIEGNKPYYKDAKLCKIC